MVRFLVLGVATGLAHARESVIGAPHCVSTLEPRETSDKWNVKRGGQLPVKDDKLATVFIYWRLRQTSPFASAIDIWSYSGTKTNLLATTMWLVKIGITAMWLVKSRKPSWFQNDAFDYLLHFSVEKWSLVMSPSTKMATKMSFCSRAGSRCSRKYLFDHECKLYLVHVRFYDQSLYDGLAAHKTKLEKDTKQVL